MKSFVDFSENLDDKKKQLMQKQRVMQQLEKERASRSNQEFQQDREEKQSKIDQQKEEEKKLQQLKKEIKKEIQQELEDEEEMDEEFGKMTKKQTQAYTGMDDKEQKALYKKMKKDGNFDVKKNLAGAASDDKDLGESVSMKDVKKLRKASSLDMSDNPKDIERARARRTEIDFKDLMRQRKEKQKGLKKEEISTPKYEDSRKDMKDFTSFMEASKTCPKGKYYCFDEKKCKPIPNGYRIGYGGRLAPDNRSDSGNGNGNSNGHSNGNGSNGNGSGNGNGGNGGNGGGGGNGGNGG